LVRGGGEVMERGERGARTGDRPVGRHDERNTSRAS
jgi:hypothetical protein